MDPSKSNPPTDDIPVDFEIPAIVEAPPRRSSRRRGDSDANWYRPGPSIQEFHESTAKIRVLVGARGSGKTTGVGVDAIEHCTMYAGAKVLGVRKTQVSNQDTSVKTFNETYDKMGYRVGLDEDISLFRKWHGGMRVRVPSRDAMEAYNEFMGGGKRTRQQIVNWIENEGDRLCSYIEFRGLKDEQKSEGQLRGYECSMFIMVEADLMEERDVDLAVGCLRWKDAYGDPIPDYSIILDTNPPNPDHWIAELEKKHAGSARYQFWHIPTRENKGNLPAGYIESLEEQYKDKPSHYRRYLLGEYADLFEGKPVYHAYKPDKHAYHDIPWPKGAYLAVSWDFGSTHANVFSAYFKIDYEIKGKMVPFEYWWDLHEFYDEQSDVDRQCRAVTEILETQFPFATDRDICSGVLHYCDPAGAQKKDTGSSIEVLNSNGFYPVYQTRIRSLHTTIAIGNRLMEIKDPLGRNVYRLDRINCPRLHRAQAGEYRYPFRGEPGYSSGEPIKGPRAGGADHIADAARYGRINCLQLAHRMMDEMQKNLTGPIRLRTRKLNRSKSY
jgi:hypothetical protein